MYRRIVKLNGKKIIMFSMAWKVIECFEYAIKHFKNTGTKENKNTYTVKFNNGLYDYTYILPKQYINKYLHELK